MNYYELLSVSPEADPQTIKTAYNTKLFECHYHLSAEHMLKEINVLKEAFHVLMDREKRLAHDESLDLFAQADKKRGLNFIEQRRQIPRVSVDLVASYRLPEQQVVKDAKVLDISSQGCRLWTKDLVKEDLTIELEIAGKHTKGTVKWKRLSPNAFHNGKAYELGIQFLENFDLSTLVGLKNCPLPNDHNSCVTDQLIVPQEKSIDQSNSSSKKESTDDKIKMIVDDILKSEGWPKFTDYKNDPGGATKGGITLKTLSGWLEREATVEELKELDETIARKIYREQYIVNLGLDKISDPILCWQLVDCAVLNGQSRTMEWLKEITGLSFKGSSINQNIALKINKLNANNLGEDLVDIRVRFFGGIISANYIDRESKKTSKDLSQFAKGWTIRALRFGKMIRDHKRSRKSKL